MKFAERIAKEVKEHAPLSLGDLMPMFNRQKKERFDPVSEVMIGACVLDKDDNQLLIAGPVDFNKVRRELEFRFNDDDQDEEEKEKKSPVPKEMKGAALRKPVTGGKKGKGVATTGVCGE